MVPRRRVHNQSSTALQPSDTCPHFAPSDSHVFGVHLWSWPPQPTTATRLDADSLAARSSQAGRMQLLGDDIGPLRFEMARRGPGALHVARQAMSSAPLIATRNAGPSATRQRANTVRSWKRSRALAVEKGTGAHSRLRTLAVLPQVPAMTLRRSGARSRGPARAARCVRGQEASADRGLARCSDLVFLVAQPSDGRPWF